MKKLLIAFLLLGAFSCTNEPEVKPSPDKIVYSEEESKALFEDRGRGEDGCLAGSPAGYCCNWGGQIVLCVKN